MEKQENTDSPDWEDFIEYAEANGIGLEYQEDWGDWWDCWCRAFESFNRSK